MAQTKLILADGKSFAGVEASKIKKGRPGEVAFNTGMTGYVESLTDPSYAGQILVFTYPLIGNYGAQSQKNWESQKIHVTGVVVSELSPDWSHADSQQSLISWLNEQNVPIISGVDTRALTKHLRTRGVMNGVIGGKLNDLRGYFYRTPKVLPTEPKIYNPKQKKTVVLVDCGAKENILRSLVNLGLTVKRVPSGYDFTNEDYDGVVISNGPGDPTDYPEAINIIKKLLKQSKPVFCICLGIQLMSLAVGAKTYKLKFGHRGHNQPVKNFDTDKCYITSQNHGYAVDAKSLPAGWRVTYKNLNDAYAGGGGVIKKKKFFFFSFFPTP